MSLEIINVKDPMFGAQGNADPVDLPNSADDTVAIQNAFNSAIASKKAIYFPPGSYYVTSSIIGDSHNDFQNSNLIFLSIFGDHPNSVEIITDQNIDVFRIRHNYKISNISIIQMSNVKQGKGIAFHHASYRSEFRSLNIKGFEYGIWGKWAIWDTFSDIVLTDNKIGIELHKNDLDGNPPAYWNYEPDGWFNNILNFLNVYVERGEIGIKAYGMGMTFIGCTTQNQTNTGIWIEGKGSGNNNMDRTWNNVIINHYAEGTNRVFYIKDARYTKIEGFFAQGGSENARLNVVLEMDNSRVKVEGSTGQDWWTNRAILHNNSVLQGDVVAVGGIYNLNNNSLRLPEFSTVKHSLSHLTSDSNWHGISGFSPESGHTYRITLSGLRDGYDPQLSEFMLFYWNSSYHILQEIKKKHLEVRVSNTGNSIEARLAYNGGLALTAGVMYIEDLNAKAL